MQLSRLDSARARSEVRDIVRRYELDDVDDTSQLIARVENVMGTTVELKPLPRGCPAQLTGLVVLDAADAVSIFLPDEHGVYSAHVLHHEVAHVLMWHNATGRSGNDSGSWLTCADDYSEYVAEGLARRLSARLLRLRTPHIEQILG